MRLAISTWTGRLAGGVETYLSALIPALLQRGLEIALVYEVDEPSGREPLFKGSQVPQWSMAGGIDDALERLRRWGPDVIFTHGLDDPQLETRIAAVAPSVLFAHAYRGTCISGTKTFASPEYHACERVLGWPCLANYLPRQCGGRSPATMMRLYQRESVRRDALGQYHGILTFSEHIASEYVRHGVPQDRVHRVPAHVTPPAGVEPRRLPTVGPVRLLFVGRMEALKGGDCLLSALPLVARRLERHVHATFAGDGRRRDEWQGRAAVLNGPEITTEFTGWLSPEARNQRFVDSDLLVVPSLWPEPFGLVGLEAGGFGLPSAAFSLGGIREWLKDGVSGALAQANPPRPEALADAVVRCVSDPSRYRALSAGALCVAASHSMQAHVSAVLAVLTAAASPRLERAHA